MKIVFAAALCLGLAAAPVVATAQTSSSSSSSLAATAPPRDVIEANLGARMRVAQSTFSDAFTELKAGDKVKGCADLKDGAEDLKVANDLLTQDLDMIKIDPSIDDAKRADLITQGNDAQTKLNATRDKVAETAKMVCPT